MKNRTALVILAMVGLALLAGCMMEDGSTLTVMQPGSAQTTAAPTEGPALQTTAAAMGFQSLAPIYDDINRGVVLIQVLISQGGRTGGGSGSGFIIDDEGHIVTNDHVVGGADQVIVTFFDGHQAEAEIVGTDDDSDLAVIKVQELPANVRILPLGDSAAVRAGDWVVAVGSPFGLGSTMTVGIVSAVGRTIPSGATSFSIPEAIQTDAAINPGNSGGPLLDLQGRVVGVNAQIASSAGVNAGVGFAIPVNIVKRLAPVLIEEGAFEWPWLGISGTSVNLFIQRANDLPTQRGAYIAAVPDDGPAAEAGLRGTQSTRETSVGQVPVGGDVIVAADGQPIADFADLLLYVASQEPGDDVTLTILRDGEEQQVTVTLEARPEN